MANIPLPDVDNDHPKRHLSCKAATEVDFQSIIESAVFAGWGDYEAASPIVDLTDHRMLSRFANEETAAVLKILRRMT